MDEKVITIEVRVLWKVLKQGRWIILSTGFTTALVVAFVLFNKPNEYTSTASVMPELESSSVGGLSKYAGLASLAGINLINTGTSDAIRPDLYPNVINNTSFFLYLLEQPVKTSENKTLKFSNFYSTAYNLDSTKGSEGVITSIKHMMGMKEKEVVAQKELEGRLIYLPKEKGKMIEELMSKITAGMDKKTGIISISAELPDPVTAAYVAEISMQYLTNFVTNYRTEKSRQEVEFLAQRLAEAKGKYYSNQNKKAQYADQFSVGTIRIQAADINRERIEADYRVSSKFYQELLQQYETAKLKVQQETPVFKALQKPVVPYKKSGPKRLLSLFFSTIFTIILASLCYILKGGNYKNIIRF